MPSQEFAKQDLVLDLTSFQLVRDGRRLRLEKTPMELLSLLASRRGALVTREEIVNRLWGDAVHVDVDAGINTAVRKIRAILNDNPASPQYVETVIGKGYRFIGPITVTGNDVIAPSIAQSRPKRVRKIKSAWLAVGFATLIFLAFAAIYQKLKPHAQVTNPTVNIAVVALKNLSETQGQDFFVNGLTEEIIAELGQLNPERIRVVTLRSSGNQLADISPNLRKQSQLQYVLEGSVRRRGNWVRISVRLVRVDDNSAVWTESFDREIGDVLQVQEEIAQRIGQELQLKVNPQRKGEPLPSELVEAYFRGRFELQRRAAPVPDAARRDFEHAIALAASYAPAYAGLADFYRSRAVASDTGANENWRLADEYAAKALLLDPESAETHVAMAQIRLLHDWDWQAAREHGLRALQLNPSSPDAHGVYARYLTVAGDLEEAINQRKQAVALDPLREDLKQHLTLQLYFARHYDEIVAAARQTLVSDPNSEAAHEDLCFNLSHLKQFDQAVSECSQVLSADGHADWARTYVEEYRKRGYQAADSLIAKRRLKEVLGHPGADLWSLANAYVSAGMREQALNTLFSAVQIHDPGLLQIRVDPDFDNIRDDPRYGELLRQINFPAEAGQQHLVSKSQ